MAIPTVVIIILCLVPVMYALYRGLGIKASFKVWIAMVALDLAVIHQFYSFWGIQGRFS